MKSLKIGISLLFLCAFVALPVGAQAQTATTARDQLIASHCKDLRNLLGQLQRRDLVSRTNLGHEYESIDVEMTAFNQRVHNNSLDSQPFEQLQTQFNDATNQFRDAYVRYDDGITTLQQIDCQNKPADFDTQLTLTRSLRDDTEGAATRASALAGQYRDTMATFQAQLPSVTTKGSGQ